MQRTASWLLAFALLGLLAPRPARACSCAGSFSGLDRVAVACTRESAAPFFTGRVISVEPDGAHYRVRIWVVRAIRGVTTSVVEVWMGSTPDNPVRNLCVGRRPFTVGEYVVVSAGAASLGFPDNYVNHCRAAVVLESRTAARADPCAEYRSAGSR